MSLSLAFLSDNVHDTTIVDSETNATVYTISTGPGIVHRTTTLSDAKGNVIGQYERRFGSNLVTFGGKTMKTDEWLPKKSIWSE